MNGTFNLSKTSLIALLDSLPHDPSDPIDPDNPTNPVILWALRHVAWLNPQPLPPLAGPQPDPWRLARPSPQPWRAAALGRTAIDRLVTEARLAEVTTDVGRAETGHGAVRTRIAQLVDEFCGNRPPRWPLPWPWPPKLDLAQLRPLDLLVIGAQFQKAADAMVENPLQADFSAAADQLLETGLSRLENSR
jgi:hypothetical protein